MGRASSAAAVCEAIRLLTQIRSVQLATLGPRATPQASYAPYVQVDGAIYVYLSRLAQHVQNLRRSPVLGAMLIRDEAHCEELFARPRLLLECTVAEHARDGERFPMVLDRFEAQFGETAATVRQLTDFSLFSLHPYAARMVSGFARAVDLDDEAMRAVFGNAPGAPFADGKE